MKSQRKSLYIILGIIVVFLFFFPKVTQREAPKFGQEYYSCACLGFERTVKTYSHSAVSCFGIPYSCDLETLEPPADDIESYEECVAAGNPILESYPRQCRTQMGKLFVDESDSGFEKYDLIRINSPLPNEAISSPLEIVGKARGTWFFEGSFPVILTNWDGLIIAEGYATAIGEWMTEDFVPYSALIEFESPLGVNSPEFMRRGALILKKDNPSGLPENDDALEITVFFE